MDPPPPQQQQQQQAHLDLAQRFSRFAFGAVEPADGPPAASTTHHSEHHLASSPPFNNVANLQHQEPSSISTITTSTKISGQNASQETSRQPISLFNYHVNFNSVREMIGQHTVELVLILVIITYLIYYFSKISSRPKLIGDRRSKFVKLIKNHLGETLNRRFNPLIYFWGTNPQTCLFGYLLGKTTSDKDMPRSKFQRQYLYISDAQYLTSNVDLSSYYQPLGSDKLVHKSKFPVQLKQRQEANSRDHELDGELHPAVGSQLDANLRLALNGMLKFSDARRSMDELIIDDEDSSKSRPSVEVITVSAGSQGQLEVKVDEEQKQEQIIRQKMSTVSSASSSASGCSSADSGVFNASRSNSSSGSGSASRSSSASSLSEVCLTSSSGSSAGSAQGENGANGANSTTEETTSTTAEESESELSSCECKRTYESPRRARCNNNNNNNNDTELDIEELEATQQNVNKPAEETEELELLPSERQEFGQCALDWHLDSHHNYHERKQVALISAGMTTGSDKKYVTDTVKTLDSMGFEVCVFIRRGVGGLTLSSAKFFSPSKWRDFEAAVQSVRQQRPGVRLVAVGFSFGSIELCRYLSMSGERSLVDAALLVSCPFDPEAGGRNMRKRALNRKIDAYLARNLGKQLHWALFDGSLAGQMAAESQRGAANGAKTLGKQQISNYNGSMINLASLPKIKSLVEFEDEINRRIQNYPNSEAYADDSRLSEHLKLIQTPTLCLSSEDDFMAPLKLLPVEQIAANPNLCMLLTRRGGHMAFVDGLVWPTKPYFAQRIIRSYMGAIEEFLSHARPNGLPMEGRKQHNNTKVNMDRMFNHHHQHHNLKSSEKDVNKSRNQPPDVKVEMVAK